MPDKKIDAIREEDIREFAESLLDEEDRFYVPPEIIPDGYAVEWKLQTVLGKRMPNQNSYEMNLAKRHWEPVSLATHPSFRVLVPKNYQGDTIENEGMLLMIRHKIWSEKSKQIQEYKAKSQLQDKLAQVGQTGSGEAPRSVQIMRRSYEPPVEVPND